MNFAKKNSLPATAIILVATMSHCMTRTLAFSPTRFGVLGRKSRMFSTSFSAATPTADVATLVDLWNQQVHKELLASQVYLSASIWCKDQELEGMAKYMLKESEEERTHALAFIDFAQKKQIPVKLKGVDAPPTSWNSVQELWQDVLKLEEDNTQSLFKLNQEAQADPALVTFLQPFHIEQVESEDELRTRVARVADESKTPGLVRQMDQDLDGEA